MYFSKSESKNVPDADARESLNAIPLVPDAELPPMLPEGSEIIEGGEGRLLPPFGGGIFGPIKPEGSEVEIGEGRLLQPFGGGIFGPIKPEGSEVEGGEGRLLQPFGGGIFGQPTVSRPKGIGNMPFSQRSGAFAMIMAALLQVDGTVPLLH